MSFANLLGRDGGFNKHYGSDQVSVHQNAVSLFHRHAKGDDNAALKSWRERLFQQP
jgi:putative membrane protein